MKKLLVFLGLLLTGINPQDSYAQNRFQDSLYSIWHKNRSPEKKIQLGYSWLFTNTDSARLIFKQIATECRKKHDSLNLARSLIYHATLLNHLNSELLVAVDMLQQAQSFLTDRKDPWSKAGLEWVKFHISQIEGRESYRITPNITRFEPEKITQLLEAEQEMEKAGDYFSSGLIASDLANYRFWYYAEKYPYQSDFANDEYSLLDFAIKMNRKSGNVFQAEYLEFIVINGNIYRCPQIHSKNDTGYCKNLLEKLNYIYSTAKASGNSYVEARSLNRLAYEQIYQKNWEKVPPLIREAEGLAIKIRDNDLKMRILFTWYDFYMAKADYRRAINAHSRLTITKDSFALVNNKNQLAQIRNMYENEQRDLKIRNLYLENQAINQETYRTKIGLILAFLVLMIAIAIFIYILRLRQQNIKGLQKNADLNAVLIKNIENQLVNVQIQALQAQMNPHFVFNALNSIQALILKDDKRMAVKYLQEFSQLTRASLENSGREEIFLSDEISFLTRYITLEQLRSNHSFEFTIKLNDEIDPSFETIPPMLLQPYVENAIKHGFAGIIKNGKLTVEFATDHPDNSEVLVCTITDNGIGRKAAAKLKSNEHNSVSTLANETRVGLMEKKTGKAGKFFVEIIDIPIHEGVSSGTIVKVKLSRGNTPNQIKHV